MPLFADKNEIPKVIKLLQDLEKVEAGSLDEQVISNAISARLVQLTITEEQAENIGLGMVNLFKLKQTKAEKAAGRYDTTWGPKSVIGLGRTVQRIVAQSTAPREKPFTCPECGAVVDKYPDTEQHCNNCGHDWQIDPPESES